MQNAPYGVEIVMQKARNGVEKSHRRLQIGLNSYAEGSFSAVRGSFYAMQSFFRRCRALFLGDLPLRALREPAFRGELGSSHGTSTVHPSPPSSPHLSKERQSAVAVMPPPIPSLSNAMADTEFLANWPGSSKEPHDGARARKRWKYAYARVRALNIFKQQGVGVLSSRVQKGSSIAERIARLEVRKHQIACPPFALSP